MLGQICVRSVIDLFLPSPTSRCTQTDSTSLFFFKGQDTPGGQTMIVGHSLGGAYASKWTLLVVDVACMADHKEYTEYTEYTEYSDRPLKKNGFGALGVVFFCALNAG